MPSYFLPDAYVFTFQTDIRQYDQCNCTADGIENPDCSASTTIRQVCQDEVLLTITLDSKDLDSALSFEPGTTLYLISEFLTTPI